MSLTDAIIPGVTLVSNTVYGCGGIQGTPLRTWLRPWRTRRYPAGTSRSADGIWPRAVGNPGAYGSDAEAVE